MSEERTMLSFVRINKRPGDLKRTLPCLAFLCLLLLFASCERRALIYYEVTELNVSVDWSQSGLADEDYLILSSGWQHATHLPDGRAHRGDRAAADGHL